MAQCHSSGEFPTSGHRTLKFVSNLEKITRNSRILNRPSHMAHNSHDFPVFFSKQIYSRSQSISRNHQDIVGRFTTDHAGLLYIQSVQSFFDFSQFSRQNRACLNYKDQIISEILSKHLGLQHRRLSFGLLYIATVLAKIQNNISRKSVKYEPLCSALTHGRTRQGFSQLSSRI